MWATDGLKNGPAKKGQIGGRGAQPGTHGLHGSRPHFLAGIWPCFLKLNFSRVADFGFDAGAQVQSPDPAFQHVDFLCCVVRVLFGVLWCCWLVRIEKVWPFHTFPSVLRSNVSIAMITDVFVGVVSALVLPPPCVSWGIPYCYPALLCDVACLRLCWAQPITLAIFCGRLSAWRNDQVVFTCNL